MSADLVGLPTLSLWQPYASLVAAGIKTSETRSWKPPDKYWGAEILIHATKRPVRPQEWAWQPKMVAAVKNLGHGTSAERFPLGVIMARARIAYWGQVIYHGPPSGDIVVCQHPAGQPYEIEDDGLGDYREDRWVWQFEDIRPLAEPIPARGYQKLWTYRGPPCKT